MYVVCRHITLERPTKDNRKNNYQREPIPVFPQQKIVMSTHKLNKDKLSDKKIKTACRVGPSAPQSTFDAFFDVNKTTLKNGHIALHLDQNVKMVRCFRG